MRLRKVAPALRRSHIEMILDFREVGTGRRLIEINGPFHVLLRARNVSGGRRVGSIGGAKAGQLNSLSRDTCDTCDTFAE